ncbi:hypothetical protein OROHE_012518 [Orobanche hederae]
MVHRSAPEIKVLTLIDKLYSLREGFREPDLGIDTVKHVDRVSGYNRVTCPKNPANIERHEDIRPRTRVKTNTATPSQDCLFDAGI